MEWFYKISGWIFLALAGSITIGGFIGIVSSKWIEERFDYLVVSIVGLWLVWFLITTLRRLGV